MNSVNKTVSVPDGIEALRLEQARELRKNTRNSCVVVAVVALYIAVLFFANSRLVLAVFWFCAAMAMIAITYLYAKIRAPDQITEANYQPYLNGHTVISALTGMLWSGFAIYQLDPESIFSMFIATSIVCSITMGGMFPTSVYRSTYLAILTASVIPLTIYWSVIMDVPERFFSIGLAIYYFFGVAMSAKTEI